MPTKYECDLCNFFTNNKTKFSIHFKTKKRKNRESWAPHLEQMDKSACLHFSAGVGG